jgi:perosamine synthetase
MEKYQQLELEFSKWNGLDPEGMVSVSSGSAALHLALEALQLPPGSECLVPDYTMIACARAVTLAGLKPAFVDCDDRLLMDWSEVTSRLWIPDTLGAIMCVHVYGRRMDMDKVHSMFHRIVGKDGPKPVIEDLAEAHGVKPHPRTDAACWSHYRNKIVGGEEGGSVWFHNPEHAKLARQLRNLGFTDAHDFMHIPRGHNYRLANCLAEKVLDSLMFADRNIAARRTVESWYDRYCPMEWRMPPRDVPWVYDLRVKGMGRITQDRLVQILNGQGIAARHGFKPMTIQPEHAGYQEVCPKALEMASQVFYLPIHPGTTTEEDCKRSFEIIRHVLS